VNGVINGGRPPDFLYDLLPRIYRKRDPDQGDPMRAVFAIAQQVYQLLENDIGELYDNWFAETCDDWVLPYLAELLAVPAELTAERPAADLRRLVGNIVDYRRRKGTADALAAVAGDVTGWSIHVAESAAALARTPFVPVPQVGATGANVRDLGAMDRLRGPFDLTARNADVRSFGTVVVSFWRDVPMTLEGVQPAAHAGAAGERTGWWFDPLGRDLPLINPTFAGGAPERSVPARLSNVRLRDDLDSAYANGSVYFTTGVPAFAIDVTIDDVRQTLAPDRLMVRDLRAWTAPPPGRAFVDAERGRFTLPPAWTDPRVTATWGTTAPIGGGSYTSGGNDDRSPAVDAVVARRKIVPNVPGRDLVWFATIGEALQYASAQTSASSVRITIADSETYDAPEQISAGFAWRTLQITTVAGARPIVKGDVTALLAAGARLTLEGFVLDGTLTLDVVPQSDDVVVSIGDATIVPKRGRLAVTTSTDGAADVLLALTGAICGPIRMPPIGFRVAATATILDGAGSRAIAVGLTSGELDPVVTSLTLDACTVFGGAAVVALTMTDSIVTGELVVRGDDSSARTSVVESVTGLRDAYRVIEGTVAFVSRGFERPSYGRLALDNPASVLSGAAGGGELGAFRAVATGRRVANLRAAVAEYVPYGVRAEVRDER
jgi:Phage tail protein (Tail_P2_I)